MKFLLLIFFGLVLGIYRQSLSALAGHRKARKRGIFRLPGNKKARRSGLGVAFLNGGQRGCGLAGRLA